MKTLNENRKGWLRSFALVVALVATSQVFVACGGGGGGAAPAPIGLPIGVGISTFNSSNCGGTSSANFIACAIGKNPGFEVLVQLSAPGPIQQMGMGGMGGMNMYSGPVLVNGVLNVLPGYGCASITSYNFTANQGGMSYDSSTGLLLGNVTATGPAGPLTITFRNTFLTANGVASVSSTGQSFAYEIFNQIQVMSGGIVGYPGMGVQQCGIPSNVYFLN